MPQDKEKSNVIPTGTHVVGQNRVPASTGQGFAEEPVEPVVSGEEPVEGATLPGQELTSQEGEVKTEGTEGQAAGPPEEKQNVDYLQQLVKQISELQQAQKTVDAPPTTEQMDRIAQLEAERDQAAEAVTTDVAALQTDLDSLTAQLESGDIELGQYMRQANSLNKQIFNKQRQLDATSWQVDSEIQREKDRREQQVAQRRSDWVRENPDAADPETQQAIRQTMAQQPEIFGDNYPGAYYYNKFQTTAKELEATKAQLAEVQKAQQTSIRGAAEKAGDKVAGQAGVNTAKPATTTEGKTTEERMLAALQGVRSQATA